MSALLQFVGVAAVGGVIGGAVVRAVFDVRTSRVHEAHRAGDAALVALATLTRQATRNVDAALYELDTLAPVVGELPPAERDARVALCAARLAAVRGDGAELSIQPVPPRLSDFHRELVHAHRRVATRAADVVAVIERSAALGILGDDAVLVAILGLAADSRSAEGRYRLVARRCPLVDDDGVVGSVGALLHGTRGSAPAAS